MEFDIPSMSYGKGASFDPLNGATSLFEAAKKYRDAGLSVMGARNKHTFEDKWRKWQNVLPTDAELHYLFDTKKLSWIGIICGAVSGGLEVIDLDLQNDTTGKIWDALWSKILDYYKGQPPFRIVQTPSGGYHIYYRCELIEGNQHLAKLKGSFKAVIETRGEGGFVFAPPTEKYHLFAGDIIPVISTDEREDLIAMCREFNEVFEEERKPRAKATHDKNTPWDIYNQSDHFVSILESTGWTKDRSDSLREYWRRPGKDAGHSATWNKELRLFYVFTSSTNFDPSKAYSPSAIYAIIKHKGNFSRAVKDIRSLGYGLATSEEKAIIHGATASHNKILHELLEQFKPLDFRLLAFPEIEGLRSELEKSETDSDHAKGIRERLDKIKINNNHYLILCIENVLKVALKNNWGLCKNNDFIYLYNGVFWSAMDKDAVQKFLGEAAERMGVGKFYARFHKFREDLFKQFLSTAFLPKPEGDKNTVLINLKNGTFEISKSGTRLRQFNSADFLTYQLPFEYDPKASAPRFQAYLDRVLPDRERQKVLSEFLGYVFIKHGSNTLKEEKALVLYGTGANGKSVFFEIVNALLGSENVSSYSLDSLTKIDGFHRANLANLLVNYASEISNKLEASIFKQLVSGEPVEARLPYGRGFMMRQYAKLIFNCNELPKDVEHTNAYFRRFLIIPFDVTIPEHEQDKTLHTKIIEEELSGVFNWVLEGLNRLLAQERFSECEAVKQAIDQYKTESNSIKLFLDENGYKTSPEKYRVLKDLYPEYRAYCYEDGMSPFKKINFSKQLQALGVMCGREAGTGKMIVFIEKRGDDPF